MEYIMPRPIVCRNVTGVVIPRRREESPQEIVAKFQNQIEAIPKDVRVRMFFKLCIIMNVAWDYMETILDLVIQRNITELKKLSRTVRELSRRFEHRRSRHLRSGARLMEAKYSEKFEDMFHKDFSKLFKEIEAEVVKDDVTENDKLLLTAVYQCLTVGEAAVLYSRWCEGKMKTEYNVDLLDASMLAVEFKEMLKLVKFYGGDCYRDLDVCHRMAGVLCRRLHLLRLPKAI